MRKYQSWGNFPRVTQSVDHIADRFSGLPETSQSLLPFGRGRSYGDVCLNNNNRLISTESLDRFIELDTKNGLVRCEAGVQLCRLNEIVLRHGYFVPVTPGTQFVTIGGMIANDVHGKNHHVRGSLGNHITALELIRSDNSRTVCSASDNQDLFNATVAGLGLTGLISWAEFKLIKAESDCIEQEQIPFSTLEEFFELSEQSDQMYEYTVSWIDTFSWRDQKLKGIFFRGNHARNVRCTAKKYSSFMKVPRHFPSWLLNSKSQRIFNRLYSRLHKQSRSLAHYKSFFYPLDSIANWNNLYGRKGFLQFQCVVPFDSATENLGQLFDICNRNNTGSFLSVLKKFGDIASPGLLSFPRPGFTLALDIPYKGKFTQKLYKEMESVVTGAGGAIYPAKDAMMSGEAFKIYYPKWEQYSNFIDPGFSSSFWRRVMEQEK